MDVQIVPYEEQYKDRLFAFTDSCFRELGKQFDPLGRHRFYEDIEHVFDVFYCLLVGNELLGTVALKKLDDDTAELKALYLDRAFRGKGLGNEALRKMIYIAKDNGCSEVYLNVYYRNEKAYKAYLRAGVTDYYRYSEDIGGGYSREDYIMSMRIR